MALLIKWPRELGQNPLASASVYHLSDHSRISAIEMDDEQDML